LGPGGPGRIRKVGRKVAGLAGRLLRINFKGPRLGKGPYLWGGEEPGKEIN